MNANHAKTLCIIAGPNGAGKTTFALEYLSRAAGFVRFINADLIAAGLSPLAPERALSAASRIFLGQIEACIAKGESFAFETDYTLKAHPSVIRDLYTILLPDIQEQHAIAAVLADMDAEIAALEARREKVRQVKQGMMQVLLTGKVRLVAPVHQNTMQRNGVQTP
ncbi:MAG: hypothetical protein JG774_1625 [Desulfomicrobiaceae bacterium]|uniref:hypothetical protein n=1 Tax=Thermodesulfomicrobium sp. WS TaxID=3004129 RepID=UPI00249337D5|nr:hypothetical protein [Thermodesulfomicrobium sp. WS]MBZ4685880.1 hypothetical protein [Desulfomicrobiaceae bacterium]MDK2872879.1 hypothetical protein [Desulfomicrobiaceae bacterium]BDV01744.1 hypothetical protein TDMWS_18290 [Thermodesulfomicrobium sp. WS]